MKKILALVMVLSVLGCVLVGCGSGDAGSSATSSATTPEANK